MADLGDVHQNDELVIVVDGAMDQKFERKILAVDMLPAGLEPETVGLTSDRDDGQFKWLKGLTEPTFFALRDDRYMAGINLTEGAPKFKFAYVVRAVSPGTFVNPGPHVEDMYAPAYHARGSAGTLESNRRGCRWRRSPRRPNRARARRKRRDLAPRSLPSPARGRRWPSRHQGSDEGVAASLLRIAQAERPLIRPDVVGPPSPASGSREGLRS